MGGCTSHWRNTGYGGHTAIPHSPLLQLNVDALRNLVRLLRRFLSADPLPDSEVPFMSAHNTHVHVPTGLHYGSSSMPLHRQRSLEGLI